MAGGVVVSWRLHTIPAHQLRPGDIIDGHRIAGVTTGKRGVYIYAALDNGADESFTAHETVTVVRERKAPAHVRDAAAAYRDARDAWERQAEAATYGYETELREYRETNPPPRFPDFLRECAGAMREAS